MIGTLHHQPRRRPALDGRRHGAARLGPRRSHRGDPHLAPGPFEGTSIYPLTAADYRPAIVGSRAATSSP